MHLFDTIHDNMYIFWNGSIIPRAKAHIYPNDLGILRGYGVYEGIKFYNNKPFMVQAHIARMKHSAKAIGLPFPFANNTIPEILSTLAKKNKVPNGVARMVITGGASLDGIQYSGTPTYYIEVVPEPHFPESLYTKGGTLITHEYLRPYPLYKTTNYIEAVRLQPLRIKKKAIEILYIHKGTVLECATSNIFIVRNGLLYTPKEDVLPGITRMCVIQLYKKIVREKVLTMQELFSADEVFMVSSFKEVVPIVSIDGRKISNGSVGPITKEVTQKFHALTQK